MIEVNNRTKYKFCKRKLNRLFNSFCEQFSLENGEVSLVIIGDKKIRNLNKEFREKDSITDVLTFPISNKGLSYLKTHNIWGEIFINKAEILRLKKYDDMFLELNMKISHSKKRESYLFYFLIAHGLFHLAGYDDCSEKDRLKMLKMGQKILQKANIE